MLPHLTSEEAALIGSRGNPDTQYSLQALIAQLDLAMSAAGAEGTLSVKTDEFGYAIITIETRL